MEEFVERLVGEEADVVDLEVVAADREADVLRVGGGSERAPHRLNEVGVVGSAAVGRLAGSDLDHQLLRRAAPSGRWGRSSAETGVPPSRGMMRDAHGMRLGFRPASHVCRRTGRAVGLGRASIVFLAATGSYAAPLSAPVAFIRPMFGSLPTLREHTTLSMAAKVWHGLPFRGLSMCPL